MRWNGKKKGLGRKEIMQIDLVPIIKESRRIVNSGIIRPKVPWAISPDVGSDREAKVTAFGPDRLQQLDWELGVQVKSARGNEVEEEKDEG